MSCRIYPTLALKGLIEMKPVSTFNSSTFYVYNFTGFLFYKNFQICLYFYEYQIEKNIKDTQDRKFINMSFFRGKLEVRHMLVEHLSKETSVCLYLSTNLQITIFKIKKARNYFN